jgi:uncharacterized membrane protein YhaH (DUF805 family)
VQSLRGQRRRSPLLWLLFGLSGRVSRSLYWLCYALVICIQSAVLSQLLGGEQASYYQLAAAIGPALLLASLYSNLAVSVKRLHDVGYGGFLALALLVPFVNVAFTIWLGILPGTAGPNRFGATSDAP